MTTPETSATSELGPREAILVLRGDVDFFTEDAFRAEAEKLLDRDGIERFVVDLGGVAVIDSSGLSLLVDLLRLCRELGVPMSLRSTPSRVRDLLEVTGLDQVLDLADSTERPAP